MIAVVIAVTLAAYLLAYLISQSTLKRIIQLTGTMRAVKKGNVTVRLDPSGNDEIAQLMGGFNQMMDRVDALMEERGIRPPDQELGAESPSGSDQSAFSVKKKFLHSCML